MAERAPILAIDRLTLAYGPHTALEGVSLRVAVGERVALLGHNGAGKSTLFKAILGFLPPVVGTIAVTGSAPGSLTARLATSYLPEQVAFQKVLTGAEVICHFARLKGQKTTDALALLDRVGLGDAAHRRVGTYSKGMRQRLGLAQALIGKPALMLLDEPTSGLDPISRTEFYAIIGEVAANGTAVLLSSHSLTEVEARTDRVAILTSGRLVADAPMAELARNAALPIRVRVEARGPSVETLQQQLGGEPVNGRTLMLTCAPEEKLTLLARIAELGSEVADVDIDLPDLQDIYQHFSARNEGGPA